MSEIIQLKDRLAEINKVDLREVEFLDDNDQVVNIDSKILEEFRFTGLNNSDFIYYNFYKKGFDDLK